MQRILIFVIMMNLASCREPVELTPAILNSEHRIDIDDCGVTYNGKRLQFGVTLEEWEKILGESIHQGYGRIWNSLGMGVVLTRINQKHPGDDGDLVVDRFLVFFQNRDDWRPLLFNPAKPETYPDSTFRDAVSINGALLARGMGYSEIQQRLDETGESGQLKVVSDVRRGTNPYIFDGTPGEYTRPPLTFCDGRSFVHNFHMARIEAPENEEVFWKTLKDYEKGNAIEVLEIKEYDADDYLYHGKKKLLESIETSDIQLKQEAKEILLRAIEKGSEEAQRIWDDNDLGKK